MRTVKCAGPQVHDADADLIQTVAWPLDVARQL
jgi:hypothetical protein